MILFTTLAFLADVAVVPQQPVIDASVVEVRERQGSGRRYRNCSLQFRNVSGAIQQFKTCADNAVYVNNAYPPENTVRVSGRQTAFAISEGGSAKFGTECIERSLAAGEAIQVNVYVVSIAGTWIRDSLVVATSQGDVRFQQPEEYRRG